MKGRDDEEEEETKEREREIVISVVAPRFTGYICLLLVQGPISSGTHSSFAFTCSFTSWQRCVVPRLPWLPKPIKVHGSLQHPHMVPTVPKEKERKKKKKLQPRSRHQADCIGQIFLCGFTRQDAEHERHSRRPLRKGLIGEGGGRWHPVRTDHGTFFSFFSCFLFFFISVPFKGESTAFRSDLDTDSKPTLKHFHGRLSQSI